MHKFLSVSSVSLLALAGACATPLPPPSAPHDAVDHPVGCPIVSSNDWRAWVDRMPGPEAHSRLVVTGNVTVPTGGYELELRLGPLQEIEPPFQMVYLIADAPDGPATQAVETKEVRGAWRGRERYSGVSIVCGGRLLADIRPVQQAH